MEKKAITFGSFDCLHVGHVEYLRSHIHGALTIGLSTDCFIEKKKGRKPLFNFDERRTALYSLREVDLVLRCDSFKDEQELAKNPEYGIILSSADWPNLFSSLHDSKTVLYPQRHGLISTTEIIRRVRALDNE